MNKNNSLFDVPKVQFHEPERNLPGRRPRVITAETRFTIQFARSYMSYFRIIHHRSNKDQITCTRQLAVNGFGIADLVSVTWNYKFMNSVGVDDFIFQVKPTVRAFEIKLSNWRRGMSQAHRYRYFADASILVLPKNIIENALCYMDTFKKIKVGLWTFDMKSKRITSYYTPRPIHAFELKYKRQALQIAANTNKALPVVRIG